MFVLFICFLTFSIAQVPRLSLTVPTTPQVSYFNTTFTVISNEGLPQVTCRITCPGDVISTAIHQLTSSPDNVHVPVPNYDGNCLASVESSGYQPATQSLTVQNYTQCQSYSRGLSGLFSVGINATVDIIHLRSGPLGYVAITQYQVTPNEFTNLDDFGGEISKGSESQLFYQSVCTNSGPVNMLLNDAGTLSLTSSTNCALYNDE